MEGKTSAAMRMVKMVIMGVMIMAVETVVEWPIICIRIRVVVPIAVRVTVAIIGIAITVIWITVAVISVIRVAIIRGGGSISRRIRRCRHCGARRWRSCLGGLRQ